MKIPNDKLPLKVHGIGKSQLYGQYTINSPGKYAGRIVGKELSLYVVKSVNNFEEAIEILKNIKLDAEMALDDRWDRSDDGFVTQIEIIEEFLNKLEDEG